MNKRDMILQAYVAEKEKLQASGSTKSSLYTQAMPRQVLDTTANFTFSMSKVLQPVTVDSLRCVHHTHYTQLFSSEACSFMEYISVQRFPSLTGIGKKIVLSLLSKSAHLFPAESVESLRQSCCFNATTLKKSDLKPLFKLIALEDVAIELQTVIDSKIRAYAQNSLTSKEQEYLKICSQKKDLIKLSPLKLHQAMQDTASIEPLLQARGEKRFLLMLRALPPSLAWYIKHHLPKDSIAQYNTKAQKIPTQFLHPLKKQLESAIEYHKTT